VRVATFNVNGVNGRLPRLLEWLAESKPDVVCLQEIKTGDATFPADALRAAGYGAIWHGQSRHHGVAVLARGEVPIEVRRGLPGDDSDTQARCLEAQVGGARIASVYLRNGNPQPGPTDAGTRAHPLAPLAPQLSTPVRERLHRALSVVYGIEPYIVLKDIWGACRIARSSAPRCGWPRWSLHWSRGTPLRHRHRDRVALKCRRGTNQSRSEELSWKALTTQSTPGPR
jgi:hypothetical protein